MINRRRKSPRILIAGATFDTNNMGVGALAASAVKCALSRYPDAQIAFLDYGTHRKSYNIHYDGSDVLVPLINLRFSKRFFLPNNVALLLLLSSLLKLVPKRIREHVIQRVEYLAEIQQADLVAGVCGGDSFSDLYGLARLVYVTLPLILCQLLERRVILLPQTYGPFRSRLSRFIARWVIRGSERAYTRDYKSRDVINALVGSDITARLHSFCYDMAFVLESRAPGTSVVKYNSFTAPETVLVGLNVSGLLWMGGYSGKNMFGLRSDYKGTICNLICSLLAHSKLKILLIPHVFGNDPNSESDVVANAQVFSLVGERYPDRISVVSADLDQSEVKYVIAECDFFIGSRMHACIAAVSKGVPSVPIAYSDKFEGVMQTIGSEVKVIDARQSTTDEIIRLVEERFANRSAVRAALMRRIPEIQQRVLSLFGDIPPLASELDCDLKDSMIATNL